MLTSPPDHEHRHRKRHGGLGHSRQLFLLVHPDENRGATADSIRRERGHRMIDQ